MPLTDDDVREILRLIDESEVDELHVETEAFSLHVRRGVAETPEADAEPPAREPPAAERTDPDAEELASVAEVRRAADDHLVTIAAPMLGTFYRAEAPGAAPFVDVGGRVEPDTVVCLIEVMKMMNSVYAGVTGTIVEICAVNAELVEHGEPLFQVQPEP